MDDSSDSDMKLFMSSSSSSTDDTFMEMMEDEASMMLHCARAASSSFNLFHGNEWKEGGFQSVNPNEGVRDVLATMRSTPSLFKGNTNFTLQEFDELCLLVVSVIVANARGTGQNRILPGRPSKLSPEQRILNFLLYLKHDNITILDTFMWNWSKSAINDDTIFLSSCINEALCDEMKWPSVDERVEAASHAHEFPGCIGIIDGTLVKIRRPWRDENHGRYFNGRKKMYCINNLVVVDHFGLFIYVEAGFPGAYHDINVLRRSELAANWRDFFTHRDDYFEYILGDPGYQGLEAFVMRRVAPRELEENHDETAVNAYNKMHAGYRVRVEWGIGGLKQKWRRLMKRFDATKPKFHHLFRSAAILTNFLHRRRRDLSFAIVGPRNPGVGEGGWEGDF